ncbi:MAG: dihydrofolate reductase [Pyrinomonadaceae bacterium]
MAIIGIAAVAENLAIGKNGKLPWHYSADLKFFRKTTTGHAVLMGANTWRSIGKRLPNRLNIILSGSLEADDLPGVLIAKSKEEVTEISKYLGCDLFVIGGSKTYESFADQIDKWIVTRIPLEVDDADVFMPDDFLDGFTESDSEEIDRGLFVKTYRRY